MNPAPTNTTNPIAQHAWAWPITCLSFCGLLLLCTGWELSWAPIRPGGSWLVLKVIPLLLLTRGIFRARVRTLQIASMLIWLYVAEGASRLFTDPNEISRLCASLEIILGLLLFIGSAVYLQRFKTPKKSTQQ